jgi:hypothetical protein
VTVAERITQDRLASIALAAHRGGLAIARPLDVHIEASRHGHRDDVATVALRAYLAACDPMSVGLLAAEHQRLRSLLVRFFEHAKDAKGGEELQAELEREALTIRAEGGP